MIRPLTEMTWHGHLRALPGTPHRPARVRSHAAVPRGAGVGMCTPGSDAPELTLGLRCLLYHSAFEPRGFIKRCSEFLDRAGVGGLFEIRKTVHEKKEHM